MPAMSHLERWWLDSWLHRARIRRYVPRLLKLCPDPFRGQVLEVGSGSGWTSRRILDTFPQVELTAVDLDPNAEKKFAALQGRYGQRLAFRQADMLNLPFDRNSFDMVLALNVLHRIEDQQLVIRQFLRVLKEGGLIGIVGKRPSAEVVEALLREEGTEIVRLEGRVHYYIWAREPYTDGRQTVVY